ncbi:hydroxysteroid 11-beta-dehydrogenase 1-like protein isoform X2 [Melopsittacus undulatus]|uniref:hydroxysteroid 11-beta-dehydrogenase 1-like protein isoform X2 n=1 Tax=Melopsittacus undulatus TaxID=13146 RepID=UPI00146C821C|nr:hydroxysteroid 11-beta-dehydrogenase 1-like protein isoform X2 [Melopsittacus undulatus]
MEIQTVCYQITFCFQLKLQDLYENLQFFSVTLVPVCSLFIFARPHSYKELRPCSSPYPGLASSLTGRRLQYLGWSAQLQDFTLLFTPWRDMKPVGKVLCATAFVIAFLAVCREDSFKPGKIPTPFTTSYSAAKFALDGFFSSLRHELSMQNISVTLCILGLINTEWALESTRGKVSLPASPAPDAALAIIQGGAMCAMEVYYPGWLYSVCCLGVLFP